MTRQATATTTLTIGQLAIRTGVTHDTLRYYERLGVIARVPRGAGGFRVYPSEVIERVRFIKQAQISGLTLGEIKDLLRFETRPGAMPCQRVQRLFRRKLADVHARLVELQEFERALDGHLARCDRALAEASDAACPVVEDLRRAAT